MSDDWGDIDEDTRMGRRIAAARRQSVTTQGGGGGRSREQRFLMTLAAVAALMLVVGLSVGFAIGIAAGRRQAPKPADIASVETSTAPEPTVTPTVDTSIATEPVTPVVEPTVSVVPSAPVEIETPNQTAPDDGDRINADRVALKWSKVSASNGEPVTYAFEIQTRADGKWGASQVISGLTTNSYSARVLQARRRWRVWAVASDGTKSEKSGWSEYAHTAAPKKTVTTTPSKTTSSTTTTGTN